MTSSLFDITGRMDRDDTNDVYSLELQKTFDSVNHWQSDQNVKTIRVDAKMRDWMADLPED